MQPLSRNLPVTAEVAASIARGERKTMILPFSKESSAAALHKRLVVLEPYLRSPGAALYAADYPLAYGWDAAAHMPANLSRFDLMVDRVKLVYDRDLSETDMIADGVYRIGCAFAWQRLAVKPAEFETARDAWLASQKAAWGPSGGRVKSYIVTFTVADRRRAVA